MTTMLVTNGTLPKCRLDTLPPNFTCVDAPNKQVFDQVCRPKWNSGAWDQFEKTIDLMPSLDTRIVCRHTLMKGVNMSDAHIKEFADLDNRADPDFIENKGYVYVGHSRENLAMENMPTHDDIMDFSNKIAPLTARKVLSILDPAGLRWSAPRSPPFRFQNRRCFSRTTSASLPGQAPSRRVLRRCSRNATTPNARTNR